MTLQRLAEIVTGHAQQDRIELMRFTEILPLRQIGPQSSSCRLPIVDPPQLSIILKITPVILSDR